MEYKSDIEIAQSCKMRHITEIAKSADVDEKYTQHGSRCCDYDLNKAALQ